MRYPKYAIAAIAMNVPETNPIQKAAFPSDPRPITPAASPTTAKKVRIFPKGPEMSGTDRIEHRHEIRVFLARLFGVLSG